MIPENHSQLIERYVHNELSEAERKQFEQGLDADEALAEKVFLTKLVHNTLAEKPRRNFRNILSAVNDAYHTNLEELFQAVPYYEALITAEARSGGAMQVVSPQTGISCNNQLAFTLNADFSKELKLTIENSKEDILLKTRIQAHTNTFTIDLPKKQFPPGRYYWKLKSSEGRIIRNFFVNKELMPQKLRNA
jgi:hypothetical protein